MSEPTNSSNNAGFTLVEMLVVAPMIVLIVGMLIGLMVSMLSDAVSSNGSTQLVYDTQNALTRIEQDTAVATTFLSTLTPSSPQGEDNSTQAFTSASGDLIISQYATTANAYDANRTIVYYANRPQACSGAFKTNQPMFVKVIYYLKTVNSVQSLYRRTIVPPNNLSNNDINTTCSTPWQRSSCVSQGYNSSPLCQTKDEKLVDSVSSMSTTYIMRDGVTTTTSPNLAKSVRVSLSVNRLAAGNNLSFTTGLFATRTTDTAAATQAPDVPTNLAIYNASVQDYNNPVLSTVSWSAGATPGSTYTVSYRVGGSGGFTSAITTGTTFGIPTGFANRLVEVSVTATNDVGTSAATGTLSYTTALWTTCPLQNNWANYGYTFTTAQYTVTSAGLFTMKGLIMNGTTGSSLLCTLPVNLRPSASTMHTSAMNGGYGGYGRIARIDVNADGTVYAIGPDPGWFSLDSIRFVLPGNITWTTVPAGSFSNGWTNLNGQFPPLHYGLDSAGRVHIEGTLKPQPLPCTSSCNDGVWTANIPSPYRTNEYIHIPSFGDATGNNGVSATYDALGIASDGSIQEKGLGAYNYQSIQTMYYPGISTGPAGWKSLSLQNNWIQRIGYTTPSYTKGSDGMVTVKGLIQNNVTPGYCSVSSVIAVLDPGYRPLQQHIYIVHSGGNWGRVDVLPNGQVLCIDAVGNYAALDSIHFLAEQ